VALAESYKQIVEKKVGGRGRKKHFKKWERKAKKGLRKLLNSIVTKTKSKSHIYLHRKTGGVRKAEERGNGLKQQPKLGQLM